MWPTEAQCLKSSLQAMTLATCPCVHPLTNAHPLSERKRERGCVRERGRFWGAICDQASQPTVTHPQSTSFQMLFRALLDICALKQICHSCQLPAVWAGDGHLWHIFWVLVISLQGYELQSTEVHYILRLVDCECVTVGLEWKSICERMHLL